MVAVSCLFLVFGIVAGFNIQSAHAGFFSSIAQFFTKSSNLINVDVLNSQQMPVLQAPLNSGGAQILGTTTGHVDQPTIAFNEQVQPNAPLSTAYFVKSGDTLWSISIKLGVSLDNLLSVNKLTAKSLIKPGEKLTIPTGSSISSNLKSNSTPAAPAVSTSPDPVTHSSSTVSYKVVSGDTLFSIAKHYNISVATLKKENNLTKDTIILGEKLIIPVSVHVSSQVKGVALQSSDAPLISPAPALVTKVNSVVVMMPSTATRIFSPDGYYLRPIVGGVKTQGIHGHNAVDLAEACGSPIYASAAGTVTIAKSNGKWNGGYGNYVEIDHSNNTQTLYAHMQAPLMVSLGQVVAQGQEIGTMGKTGDATGCHVHFEIHNNGYANPF